MNLDFKKILLYLAIALIMWGIPFSMLYYNTGEPVGWRFLLICTLVSWLVLSLAVPQFKKTWKEASIRNRISAYVVGVVMISILGVLTYLDLGVLGNEFLVSRIYLFAAVSGVIGLLVNFFLKRYLLKNIP